MSIVDILLEGAPVQKYLTGKELLGAIRLAAKELPDLGIVTVNKLPVPNGDNIEIYTHKVSIIVQPRGPYKEPAFSMSHGEHAEFVDLVAASVAPFIEVKHHSVMMSAEEIVARLETTKIGLSLVATVRPPTRAKTYRISYSGNCGLTSANSVFMSVAIESQMKFGDDDDRTVVYCTIDPLMNTCRLDDLT